MSEIGDTIWNALKHENDYEKAKELFIAHQDIDEYDGGESNWYDYMPYFLGKSYINRDKKSFLHLAELCAKDPSWLVFPRKDTGCFESEVFDGSENNEQIKDEWMVEMIKTIVKNRNQIREYKSSNLKNLLKYSHETLKNVDLYIEIISTAYTDMVWKDLYPQIHWTLKELKKCELIIEISENVIPKISSNYEKKEVFEEMLICKLGLNQIDSAKKWAKEWGFEELLSNLFQKRGMLKEAEESLININNEKLLDLDDFGFPEEDDDSSPLPGYPFGDLVNNQKFKEQNNHKTCTSCQTQNEADANFCKNCGSRLELSCSGCGKKVNEEDMYCSNCGNKLK